MVVLNELCLEWIQFTWIPKYWIVFICLDFVAARLFSFADQNESCRIYIQNGAGGNFITHFFRICAIFTLFSRRSHGCRSNWAYDDLSFGFDFRLVREKRTKGGQEAYHSIMKDLHSSDQLAGNGGRLTLTIAFKWAKTESWWCFSKG